MFVLLISLSNGCSVVPGTVRSRSIDTPTLKKLALEDRDIPVEATTGSTGDADSEPAPNPLAETHWSPDDLMIGTAIKANLEGQRFAMSQRWEPVFESSKGERRDGNRVAPHVLKPLPVEVPIANPVVQSAHAASVTESTAYSEEEAPTGLDSSDCAADADSSQNTLDQLLSQLQSANHLHLSRVCLCRQVDGFGQVVEFPDAQFAAGEDILIYCEVDNFTSQTEPNVSGTCHRASLSGSYLVINGDGEVVAEHEYPVVDDISCAERDDFFLVFPAQIPPLGPGRYRMYLVVHDELAQDLVAHAEPIQFQIALTGQAQR